MSIDQKLLESFSADQVMLASNFLETIYIHDQTNVELNNDNEITVFSTLIQASAEETMKCNLFFSLSVNSQKKCFSNLIYSDQSCLLLNINNNNLLVSLFSALEPSLQNEFLTKMFTIVSKSIKPTDEEIQLNSRSRSAKLNILEKYNEDNI